MSPVKTLEICQKLYEQGILTYPRSDCEYLPDAHHDEAEKVLTVIEKLSSVKVHEAVDKESKTPVFNSKKVEKHHAIIPSFSCKITTPLEGDEALIFELVAKRYISFFMPDYEFLQVNINADIDGELFTASWREILNEGWKSIEKDLQDKDDKKITMTKIFLLHCLKLRKAKTAHATILTCWKRKLKLRQDSLRLLCSKL